MDQPGHYFHWSIFNISDANLLVITLMLVLFGLALFLPFPKSKRENHARTNDSHDDGIKQSADAEDTGTMWTARLRRTLLRLLPPKKLIPDWQPAYVDSWIYVFGIATLAALVIVVVSGLAIALGGPDWWHTDPVGHLLNSIHLWSVELFMAFMVIHLWGKFWMAAWRGKRTLTWITGMFAFLVSVIQCFTGYLSQQNFDSQWIATNGKDAMNPLGIGALFNLLNFGEMLLWHIVLVPIALLAIIGFHVVLVRIRGVVHPIPLKKSHNKQPQAVLESAEWRGPVKRYDLLKEGAIALAVVYVLVLFLASVFSSPDVPPVTIADWANQNPADFMNTAANELAGTSDTANYGPPYNNGTDGVQTLGIPLQTLSGVHLPIDTAQAFVLSPLSKIIPTDPTLANALNTYESADGTQQQSWNKAYSDAVDKVTFTAGTPVVPTADDGPIPTIIATELTLARSGALDADLIQQRTFYGTDYTKPLMFLMDGEYFSSLAEKENLTGDQWGVMNETGSYPGQPWLWLYTMWYQIPGLGDSPVIDLWAIYLTALATIVLIAVPFIPGLRDIPYLIPIHRLVWRRWNKRAESKNLNTPEKR